MPETKTFNLTMTCLSGTNSRTLCCQVGRQHKTGPCPRVCAVAATFVWKWALPFLLTGSERGATFAGHDNLALGETGMIGRALPTTAVQFFEAAPLG